MPNLLQLSKCCDTCHEKPTVCLNQYYFYLRLSRQVNNWLELLFFFFFFFFWNTSKSPRRKPPIDFLMKLKSVGNGRFSGGTQRLKPVSWHSWVPQSIYTAMKPPIIFLIKLKVLEMIYLVKVASIWNMSDDIQGCHIALFKLWSLLANSLWNSNVLPKLWIDITDQSRNFKSI